MFSATAMVVGLFSIVVVESDVVEVPFREGKIPFLLDAEAQGGLKAIRLFVSDDRGVTWKPLEEVPATEKWFKFNVADDGLYWFAVQTIRKNGRRYPKDLEMLLPSLKVYVNRNRRPLVRRLVAPLE